ncbi:MULTISPECIES: creatininase family protein [unclassified Rhodococcus (in: high G+C Gram-positive bacteria)]|uniref:creatininase family protein n=1 Tax=unclassified Rhodococcus (in: high G+C Gram-positive bacteria) TaxID=192944 RepID=UPI0021D0888A|nr:MULTISPECIES: creatininase family protein [unclassified Rhodococcus (in: high G+C Gram-positive bacteria)]MDI9924411.1 creatininase family protein [Rhodococcus sp. IEGM 1341]
MSSQHNVFQLPVSAFGCSHEHADISGTVSIAATTLNSIVIDLIDALNSQGTRGLVIVNAHGGNYELTNASNRPTPKSGSGSGCFRVAKTGQKREKRPVSPARIMTTCTPANSKRQSCSPCIRPGLRRMAERRSQRARPSAPSHPRHGRVHR